MKNSNKVSIAIIDDSGFEDLRKGVDLFKIAKEKKLVIEQVLKEAIVSLPKTRNCVCAHALEGTQP